MTEGNSDNLVISRERNRVRRAGYLQYAVILFLVLSACWTYWPGFETWRLAADPYDFYVMGACIAAMLIYGLAFVGMPSVAARSERLIPRQVDVYLTQARWQWLLSLVLLLGPVAGTSRLIANIDEGIRAHRLPADYFSHSAILSPAMLGILFIGYSLSFVIPITWFRPAYKHVLQDELVRELRAKAVKVGYISAVSAIGAGFIVLATSTVNPMQLMLWLGYLVVALPVLSYVALEAMAGRE